MQISHFQGLDVLGKAVDLPNPFGGEKRLKGRGFRPLSDELRNLLADAIFIVEDEIEHRANGQRHHAMVDALNAIRNRIYDDIGVNE